MSDLFSYLHRWSDIHQTKYFDSFGRTAKSNINNLLWQWTVGFNRPTVIQLISMPNRFSLVSSDVSLGGKSNLQCIRRRESRSANGVRNSCIDTSAESPTSVVSSLSAKSKKFLQSNGTFPMESFLKLLDFVDRPNPAVTKELNASLAKSSKTLSVSPIHFSSATPLLHDESRLQELFVSNPKSISAHGNDYFKYLFPALRGDKQRSSKSQAVVGVFP